MPCGEGDLAGYGCDVRLIVVDTAFMSASSPSYSSPTFALSPLWSSLLYFELPSSVVLPVWLYAHVRCHDSKQSDALVTLLLWTAANQTAPQQEEAVIQLSSYNASQPVESLTANPRPLSTQLNGGPDTLVVTPLTEAGYYGLLLTNTNATANRTFAVNLSSYSSRPFVSLASAYSLDLPVDSLGLFALFLLLSSLCLGCLVLGRRYLAGFRRKGGKKYHGVSKLPEGGDGRGGQGNGGGGLDGRVEGGDTMEAWDAEMKEMDSLELQLSDEGEQSEFELNEIATIYRQPQPVLTQPHTQPPPQQQQHPMTDGAGKRSPGREETKMNGNGTTGERSIASPLRLNSVVVEGQSRQSPPPLAQPPVQPAIEAQQRVQPPTSGKKKKKREAR